MAVTRFCSRERNTLFKTSSSIKHWEDRSRAPSVLALRELAVHLFTLDRKSLWTSVHISHSNFLCIFVNIHNWYGGRAKQVKCSQLLHVAHWINWLLSSLQQWYWLALQSPLIRDWWALVSENESSWNVSDWSAGGISSVLLLSIERLELSSMVM